MALLEDKLKRRPYSLLNGNRVIEVRHAHVTKGQALVDVLKRHKDADFLFCAGDDRTDEEMMAAIPRRWRGKAITVWVGGRNPHASYWAESNGALLAALEAMAARWERKGRERARRKNGSRSR